MDERVEEKRPNKTSPHKLRISTKGIFFFWGGGGNSGEAAEALPSSPAVIPIPSRKVLNESSQTLAAASWGRREAAAANSLKCKMPVNEFAREKVQRPVQ